MNEFDTIIIGSGAGGLASAICLARAGQKVLVLEQHDVPGGWCHSFTLNGHRFSPGVHYVGMVDKGCSTHELYAGLGVANDLVFFRMNKNGYEHCWIENKKIDMPAGIKALHENLSNHFPKERKRLKKYLELVRTVSYQIQLIPKMKGFWDHITIPFRTRYMGKYGLFSLKRVIDWHIRDPLLKAILSIQCGDHGMPPGKASFPLHCAVMDHYLEGGFYPMGGGGGIVKALTKSLKRLGGELRTRQHVLKIIIENKEAVGVALAGGERIFAKTIVSNADPAVTYLNLVGKENLSARLAKKISKTTWSVASLILFLTLDLDVTKAGFDSGNVWLVNDRDLDSVFAQLTHPHIFKQNEFPALFISCPTLKDPTSFDGRHHNLEIVTMIDYNSFSQFHTLEDHHGNAYAEFKNKLITKILNSLERIMPGTKQHVVQAALGTPKTNEYYIKSTRGNIYGTEKTLGQVGPFGYSSTSEIKNLFLCGASTLSHGIAGATHSGVHAAAKVLGCSPQELLMPTESQAIRVYDAEDSSTWPAWIHRKREVRKSRSHSTARS